MPTALHPILRAFKSEVAGWLDLKLKNYRPFFFFFFFLYLKILSLKVCFVQQSNIEGRPWEFFDSSGMRCCEILEPGNNLPAGAGKNKMVFILLYISSLFLKFSVNF